MCRNVEAAKLKSPGSPGGVHINKRGRALSSSNKLTGLYIKSGCGAPDGSPDLSKTLPFYYDFEGGVFYAWVGMKWVAMNKNFESGIGIDIIEGDNSCIITNTEAVINAESGSALPNNPTAGQYFLLVSGEPVLYKYVDGSWTQNILGLAPGHTLHVRDEDLYTYTKEGKWVQGWLET